MSKKPKLSGMVEELRPEPKFARKEEAKAKVASYILAGYTQEAAAEKAGVHHVTISKWKASDPEFAAIVTNPARTAHEVNEVWRGEGRTNVQLKKAADIAVLRYKLQGIAATAIDVLADLLHSEDDRIRLGAVREVLDRTGMVRSSEVTVTGSIASQVTPTMLAEAFQVLGISPEEARKSLPVDGTVIESKEVQDEGSVGRDIEARGVPEEDAGRPEESLPAGGASAPVSPPPGVSVSPVIDPGDGGSAGASLAEEDVR